MNGYIITLLSKGAVFQLLFVFLEVNMKDGFIKIACATPDVKVANCGYNADRIIEIIKEAHDKGVKIVCFPELSVTGYTCGDLFLQDALLSAAKNETAPKKS